MAPTQSGLRGKRRERLKSPKIMARSTAWGNDRGVGQSLVSLGELGAEAAIFGLGGISLGLGGG